MCNQEENQRQRLILIVDSEKHFLSSLQRNLQEDFDIKIPAIVKDKIAKEIQININYELVEKK